MRNFNHNRPSLQLLDNFRREIARADARIDTNVGKEFGGFGSRVEREDALAAHQAKIKMFAPDMQAALVLLLERHAELKKTKADLSLTQSDRTKGAFQRGMTIKFQKKCISKGNEELVSAGATIFSGILFATEDLDGEPWNWLVQFLPLLDKGSASDWREMLNVLTDRSLPLAVARQAADTPEGVERFLSYMAEAEPE